MSAEHQPGARERRLARLAAARLYFVCEGLPGGESPDRLLEAALAGGADLIQLREPAPRCDEELLALAEPFRRAADAHGALFILNDRPDLVAATAADGVHVGQDDMAVAEARELAGPDALIGLSTHSEQQIISACEAGDGSRPDQMSVGPIWETPTKEGRPATGLGLIAFAAANADLPWFAIGGIDTRTVAEVAAAGAERVVVVRAIRDAGDPELAARELRSALSRTGAPA
jgi:thiamine-phosphate pyrophosphorylase